MGKWQITFPQEPLYSELLYLDCEWLRNLSRKQGPWNAQWVKLNEKQCNHVQCELFSHFLEA